MTRRAGRRAALGVVAASWVVTTAPAGAWPTSTVDPGQVDRTVRDVLRDPAFTAAQGSWLTRLRENVRQWLVEQISTLFASGAGTVLAWALVGLAVVVGVLVAARAVRGIRRSAASDAGPDAVVVTRRPPDDWLADARAAQADGDLGEAIRCAYRAVVAGLGRQGALEEVPGRTVGEYRAQVADRRPDRADAFGRASEVFERAWYAQLPVAVEDVQAVLAVASDITADRRHVPAGAGA